MFKKDVGMKYSIKMANLNEYWNEKDRKSARRAGLLLTAVAGALIGTIIGCFNQTSQNQQAKKSLEEVVVVEGIPSMPFAKGRSYAVNSDISFVLNAKDNKEYICLADNPRPLNEIAAAVIDAHEDNQNILVYGKLKGKRLEIYSMAHPDFGLDDIK